MNTHTAQPLSKTAEVIHIEVLRSLREQRALKATEVSAEARNLSAAWSK